MSNSNEDIKPSQDQANSPNALGSDSVSPDDILPSVEPPSAKFLIQLFVIPAIIVGAVVLTLFLVTTLVEARSTNPEQLIKGLEASGAKQWQSAKELADLLRNNKHIKIRKDAALTKRLSDLLQRLNQGKDFSDAAVTMRVYVCHALAQFMIPDGMPALVETAQLDRDEKELDAREAAVMAIAKLSGIVAEENKDWAKDQSELVKSLNELSKDKEPRIRAATTFAFGALGTPEAIKTLKILVDDSNVNVSYNAAGMLAYHGNIAAIETLTDMLDLDNDDTIELEKDVTMKRFKRSRVILNALRATTLLKEKAPDVDITPLLEKIEIIVKADKQLRKKSRLQANVISEAKVTLDALNK